MIYCYDKRHPISSFKREIEAASKNNQVIFYDSEVDGFTDLEGKIVDIKNQFIMVRTWANQITEINEEITRFGGLPLVDEEETKRIEEWPHYYKPLRKAIILTGEELISEENISTLESTFGSEIFIKTKEKNFNGIAPISLLKDSECAFYKTVQVHSSDEFIVSGKVDILEDKYGKKEYRCFVINGQVANISRFTDNILHRIDSSVLRKAKEIVSTLKDTMPLSYVVDLFEYELDGERQIDVVEFNPIQASGIYLYNSAVEISDDILHNDLSSLPYETMDKLSECQTTGQMINQRDPLYKVPFSFAGDLRSIFLTGHIGVTFTDVPMSPQSWASKTPIFGGISFTSITNEESLTSDADLTDNKDSNKKLTLEVNKKETE